MHGAHWGCSQRLAVGSAASAGWPRLGGVSSAGGCGRWDSQRDAQGFGHLGVHLRWEFRFCRWSTSHYWRGAFLGSGPWLTDKTQTLSFSGCFLVLKHKTRLATFSILLLRGHRWFRIRLAT